MEPNEPLLKKLKPAFVGLIVLFILVGATVGYTRFKTGQWEKDIRARMLDYMTSKKSKLEKALYSRIYYTRGVAAYVALNPGISNDDYYELAKEYIRNDTVISSMALSKNCILNAIYPLEEHEAALGLNLLEHPERKIIVEKTIETHKTFVAGPTELVEGGIAFISYTPIFDKTSPGNEKFWGVTDIVIKMNALFNEAKLELYDKDYVFALKGYNGTGENGEVFWGNDTIFEENPVKVNIDLPNGTWVLAAVPEKGWKSYGDQDKVLFLLLTVSALIISILVAMFSRALIQLRQSERELKAIFASLDSLIIEFSREGKYLKVASQNRELLYLPAEELIGKSLEDIFDKEKSDFFKKAIKKCLDTKKLVVIDYNLEIDGEEHWFSARISYKSENTIIYNAYDITASKRKEKCVEESENQLKKLNETKDRFFSIIAHDLRSPLASQKSLVDLILQEYDNISTEEKKELLVSLKESSHHVYILLENLLKWSMAQSGRIEVKPEEIDFGKRFAGVLKNFSMQAEIKNIRFKNLLQPRLMIKTDANLTEVVFRNLLSNAVKFTNTGGEISITSEVEKNESGDFVKIGVRDSGIGISAGKMNSLFEPGKNQSTPGTGAEKGNGLGLILCKEFAELQGGTIQVESTLGKGSTFYLLLPLD
ncbi:sensor histidine kinase [Maribellus maritimus]|uniref:sensor histidine kinase n=1 Tax=Maribellus maritimus TaxID=2870838 RepID=UPI001EEC662C|nr:ATP-binding protein [Maribellus maritimus]MCG6187565.1 CHASE domain-containing protein [Maribellus maritimus]